MGIYPALFPGDGHDQHKCKKDTKSRDGPCFFCLRSTIASAQVAGGTLLGVVTDPTETAVRGAQVTIRNVATAVTAHVTTDRDGAYSLSSLLPGIYELTVGAPTSARGFKAAPKWRLGGTLSRCTSE